MSKKEFEIIEEDGVVIYDAGDDYAEDEIEGEFHLMTNEEIFTDEYMVDFARKMDAKIARDRKLDKLISSGVIAFTLLITGFFCLLFFH